MYLAGFEEILEAVNGRIRRYVETRDSADLLAPAGVRDAAALLTAAQGMARRKDDDPPREPWLRAATAAGLLHYARHADDGNGADEREAARLLESVRAHGGDEPTEAKAELDAAVFESRLLGDAGELDALNMRAIMTPADAPLVRIDENAALLRLAMAAGDGLDLRMYESNLIGLLMDRYGRTGHEDDLREATDLAGSLVERTERDHDAYARRVSSLAMLHQMAFARTGAPEALDAAVELMRTAVRHTAGDHEDHAMHLSNLGRALKLRYQTATPEPAVIAESVDLLEKAVATTADDEHRSTHATRRGELAIALALHYDRTGDLRHLEAATQRVHEAWELTPPNDHNVPERLHDMSSIHLRRYQAARHAADKRTAKRAAQALQKAVPREHPLHEAAQSILQAL